MFGIIALAGLLIVYFTLSSRISALEQKLSHQAHQRSPSSQPESSSAPTANPAPSGAPAATTPAIATLQSTPSRYAPAAMERSAAASPSFDIFGWLAQDFLVKLGAFLLLLAFGWFVSYAFANNWIGPAGRIVLGLLAGAVFMGVGVWRIERFRHQGGIFTVLGSSIVLLTVFAARELYEFFTPETALAIMFASVAFVAFVAARYQSAPLALAGLVLGAMAPFFTNTEPNVVALFSYALVLVLGSLWVQRQIATLILPVAAFMVVVAYGVPYLLTGVSGADQSIALLFSFVFTTIFFVANTVSTLIRQDAEALQAQSLLAAGTGLYLVCWIVVAADPVWHSLLYAGWMIVFAVGAFLVFIKTGNRIIFYLYGAVSIGLLAAATAAELSGPILTIAYCVEILALIAMCGLYTSSHTITSKLSWLFIGPIILSFEHITSTNWQAGFLHNDFFALMALVFCLLVAGQLLIELRPTGEEYQSDDATALVLAAAVYGVVLVWLITHSVFAATVAVTVSLFMYTIAGIGTYLYGLHVDRAVIRMSGAVLIALVVGRLLLIDVWSMELVGRIITFFGIGLLFISTAFIGNRRSADS